MSTSCSSVSIVGLALCGALAATGCRPAAELPTEASRVGASERHFDELRPAITAFCGNCHAMPLPESFPQDAWFAEVEQGYKFYLESGRSDLKPPPMRDAVAYFRHQAPRTLALPPLATDLTHASRFRQQSLPDMATAPAISFVDRAESLGPGALWLCDMHSGSVSAVTWRDGQPQTDPVAKLQNPARTAVCDLDGDGRRDLVAADLGSFVPGDHDHGRVLWLPDAAEPDRRAAEPQVVMGGVGRIADVRPADFDGDGLTDLVVAEFGWRKTGRVQVLLQTERNSSGLQFRPLLLDERHGAIHVPVADLDRDGRPDVAALISQEYEVIEAYLNRGSNAFERRTIFAAHDPAFGSSGIELVDLDGDGDLDILATNGDTLDSHYLKPAHGVFWLENRGEFPFTLHRIARLPGAMRAIPVDLDGDGDLDVVAAAFLPATLRRQQPAAQSETLVWLEQTLPGQFERHTLETGELGHMTVCAADLNADGRMDLVVPNYAEQRTVSASPLTIWWNGGTASSARR